MAKNEPKMGLGPFEFRPARASVKGRPPLAEWQGPLQFALWCQRASPWWIGDMIVAPSTGWVLMISNSSSVN